jgi:hypothetical protein
MCFGFTAINFCLWHNSSNTAFLHSEFDSASLLTTDAKSDSDAECRSSFTLFFRPFPEMLQYVCNDVLIAYFPVRLFLHQRSVAFAGLKFERFSRCLVIFVSIARQ